MTVTFSSWDYFGSMLLWLLVPIALFLLIFIPLSRFILRKTKNAAFVFLSLLLFIPLMAALFVCILPAGERTGCLYPKENAYTHTTAGTVTAVRPADHIPLYFYDGAFRGGVYVTMDGVEYYSIAHPMLTGGVSLHFTYCPEDDLIMGFSPIEEAQVATLQKPFVKPEPVPEEPGAPVPKLQSIIGTVCFWSGFLGFALLVKADDWITLRVTNYLLARDREQRGEVIPNPAVPLVAAVLLLPIFLIVLGSVLSSNSRKLLFILLPGMPMVLFFPRFCAAHVRLEGRNIRIRRFFREQTVPLSSLRSVYWSNYRRSISRRKLVLAFDGWTLELEQDSHLGLADLHRRLSALLHITP